ncbi:MAG: AAA family ATPase, partial [Planctomycetes bacterium]|nr:AAA family ATPase [Planctomycetota bacterium]
MLGSSAAGVLVMGQPGVGKSRLRRELVRRLSGHARPPQILVARGDFDGAGAPLSMLVGAVRTAAGILMSDSIEVQRAKLAGHVARVVSEDGGARRRVVEFLGEMIGAPIVETPSDMLRAARADARLMHDAMRSAWEDWLAAEAVVRPIVLVLDDLQWADIATVEFVDAAMRTLADQPFFVLALARPGVRERLPSLWADRDLVELVLGPLPREAATALVREALGPSVARALVERVVDRADGNAFYLEELVRSVSEGHGEKLPESVVGMVQSRLEAVGDEARRVLRAASVFGQRFWAGGVLALLGSSIDADGLRDALAHIVSREIVSRRPSSAFEGEVEYAFRSGLVRDAAYELLTENDRVTGHRLAGGWLAAAGERDPLVLAEHFSRGQEPARALDAFHRAAGQSLDANDFATCLECSERALTCDPSAEVAGALRLMQSEALSWLGQHERALLQASEAAGLLGRGTTAWFNALSQSFTSLSNLGDYDRVTPLANEVSAMKVGREHRDAQVSCLCRAAGPLIEAGRYDDARPLVERAELLAIGAARIEPATTARISRVRAVRALHLGDYAGYLRDIATCVQQYELAGHHRMACNQTIALAFGHIEVGEHARAEALLRAAIATASRAGLVVVEAFGWQNLAYALLEQGRLVDARAAVERSLELAKRTQVPRLEGGSRSYLARIALAENDLVTAEREARRAVLLLGSNRP